MKILENSSPKPNSDLIRSDSANTFIPNWTNIVFFSCIYGVGLLAVPIYFGLGGVLQWKEILIAVGMFFFGSFSITFGYHRALSHRSFKMSSILKWLTLIGGASTAEGSALAWCADHRRHHKFQDTTQDPYNIRRGFWWAHMGWILGSPSSTDYSNCPDLQRDALVRHQDRYYAYWLTLCSFGLPLMLGFLFGRPLQGLLFGGFTRLFLVNQVTFCINSYAHYFGRRPYSTQLTARDSLVCALLANGEGWHNFHHKFPFDYRNGHRFYHYDPTKWLIRLGSYLGLAHSLKETPAQEIYKARIQTQRGRLASQSAQMKSVSETLDTTLERWTLIGLEWQRIKSELGQKGSSQVRALKQKMQIAKKDFKKTYALWRQSTKTLATSRSSMH